ncbi:MAG: SRPBCC domain-containing protein [Jiangellaceae bacterium]
MTNATETTQTVQVYRVYIKASAQAIWDAITKPEWTEKYGYRGRVEFDLRPGGAFRTIADEGMQAAGMPEVVVDGEVVEADPPRRLVQTWRARWNDEGFTRLTYDINEREHGVSSLTVTHELDGAPQTAAMVGGQDEDKGAGGGWAEVLSDLKSLLETGKPLTN